MTTLKQHIIERIQLTGPISIADYIRECLLHPSLGYYTTKQVFGKAGDFVTAPEISQMFGELLGLCLAQTWMDQGQPDAFALVELGPGRGTLMQDLMRATKNVPGFHSAANIHLYEASPALQKEQALRVGQYNPTWITSLEDLPELPLFLVANEFFDALPIRQFERAEDGWQERLVGVQNGSLVLGKASATVTIEALTPRLEDTRQGDLVEMSPEIPEFIQIIGNRINTHGGTALIIDYGDWISLGDTLQALKNHAYVDPFEAPGEADLTSHVDFEVIARTAPCGFSRVTPQGILLERLGISARAEHLAANLTGSALDTLIAAHRRLTHPDEMGNLFKAIALFPKGGTPPAGFET